MKSSLALIAIFLATQSAAQTLAVGFVSDKPPYVFAGAGIEVDLAAEAFQRIGAEMKPVFAPNIRTIAELKAGRLDAASVLVEQVELARSDPFVTFENGVFTRAEDKVEIAGIADLAPLAVIAWQNARIDMGSEFARMAAANPRYQETGSQESQVRALAAHRYAAVVMDRRIFLWHLRHLQAERSFPLQFESVVFHPLSEGRLDIFLTFRDAALAARFNEALRAMRLDGTYDRILARYSQ